MDFFTEQAKRRQKKVVVVENYRANLYHLIQSENTKIKKKKKHLNRMWQFDKKNSDFEVDSKYTSISDMWVLKILRQVCHYDDIKYCKEFLLSEIWQWNE